ncbi:MAG: ABC transporter permease [Dehalococcoidia bacterium]|nr:MAG: ABC transporter permease [Dehalococcoidia bacterium]
MTAYILRRLLISIPLLLGITIIVFILADQMPGDAVLAMITDETPMSEDVVKIRKGLLGLDQPLYVQYGRWINQVLRGNLGYSFQTGEPVSQLIGERIFATLELMGVALLFSIIFGVTLGVISALKQYSLTDYSLTMLGFLGVSIPDFFIGLVLVYIFALKLKLLPTSGMVTAGEPYALIDNLRHLILPAMALGLLRTATFTRYTRASMLEIINQDYIRTARAKGLKQSTVILKHALRSALIPVITIIGIDLPILFGGSIIIETIFQWPGIGLLFMTAISGRDAPLIMGYVLFSAVIVLTSNFLTDIVYSWVDPRVRYD